VVIVYVVIVALCAAVGGRLAGFFASLSAALAYNFFFTTPYGTLRIDSWGQILTVALLFVAGVLASLSGRAGRRARVEARDEAAAIQLLTSVTLAGARGGDVDRVAAEGLRELLGARAVRVVRADQDGELVVAEAGQAGGDLDPAGLPHLDEEGRIPAGTGGRLAGPWCCPPRGWRSTLSGVGSGSGRWWWCPRKTGRCCAPLGWRSRPRPMRSPWPGAHAPASSPQHPALRGTGERRHERA
jgi:hypothetical protein